MADANWYVVHTYSGYENKVKANIEKTIENRKLQDQILEVSVPLETAYEIKNGVKKQVQRKLFPGYVLIHMEMNDETWYVVRNTRGVTGFVGPGSKPVPLSEAEMRNMGLVKEAEVIVDFANHFQNQNANNRLWTKKDFFKKVIHRDESDGMNLAQIKVQNKIKVI